MGKVAFSLAMAAAVTFLCSWEGKKAISQLRNFVKTTLKTEYDALQPVPIPVHKRMRNLFFKGLMVVRCLHTSWVAWPWCHAGPYLFFFSFFMFTLVINL